MRLEFRRDGYDVQFVTVNMWDAVANQHSLYEKCSFPIFQDVSIPASDNVWNKHVGKKDDMYIYDRNGILAKVFPYASEEFNTNMSTPEGYAFVKNSIIEVLEQ